MKSKKSDDKTGLPNTPLADRVRPKSLTEFYGQEHLVGEGKPIRLMIENQTVTSFILCDHRELVKQLSHKLSQMKLTQNFIRSVLFLLE